MKHALIMISPCVVYEALSMRVTWITSSLDSWPAFLYPKARGDIYNIEQGHFHGVLLLEVYRKPLPCGITNAKHSRLLNSSSLHLPQHKTLSARQM